MQSYYEKKDRTTVEARIEEYNEMLATLSDADTLLVELWDSLRVAVKMLNKADVPHSIEIADADLILETVQGIRAIILTIESDRDTVRYRNSPEYHALEAERLRNETKTQP